MKIIRQPYEKVIAIIKTNKPATDDMRFSLWTVPFAENGVYLMKHTFSGEIVSLTREEFEAPERVEELVRHRFVVPADYDEAQQYIQTIKMIKLMQPEKPGLKTYTILPTTACNARCTYCYEEGYAIRTMTREIVDRLIDFICETRQEDEITLSWFGGEPLVCADSISYVCRELEKRGVPFKSRMITNGSYFTKDLAREAKEVWRLDKVQVSLDGDKRDYNERKRYIDPVRYNYDTVMRSIHYVADEGIKVILRVNFDRDSIGRLRSFLDEMKVEFGKAENVWLYLSGLYQEKYKPGFIELMKQKFEIERYIDRLGINRVGDEKTNVSFRLNSCMADSLDKSIVIDPEGKFYNCEHLPERNTWGNIFDGVTDKKRFEELSSPYAPDEQCLKCAFLPICKAFYKKGCPGWFDTCMEYMYLETEYELRRIAEKELENA